MIKKTVTYIDYNGVEKTEDFRFNLTEAELIEMELEVGGGLTEQMKAIVAAKDVPEIIRVFKRLILRAYGEMSPDGKYFMKVDKEGNPLSLMFSQTEAYSKIFMELATNDEKAAEFVNGIVPKHISEEARKQLSGNA